MNTSKQIRILSWGFGILLVSNLITLYFLLSPHTNIDNRSIVKAQQRIDSLSGRIDRSQQAVDSVIKNINRTLELSSQLDEQVIALSSSYQKDRSLALKNARELQAKIKQENDKLQSLKQELEKL